MPQVPGRPRSPRRGERLVGTAALLVAGLGTAVALTGGGAADDALSSPLDASPGAGALTAPFATSSPADPGLPPGTLAAGALAAGAAAGRGDGALALPGSALTSSAAPGPLAPGSPTALRPGVPGPVAPRSPAAPPPTTPPDLPPATGVRARAADSLVEGYGVTVHLDRGGTPYTDVPAVTRALTDLGVRHVRTRLYGSAPGEYAALRTLARAGIRSDLVLGAPDARSSPRELVATAVRELPAGSVDSFEGANEWNLSGDPRWAVSLREHQQQVWTAVKGNPATKDVPVLAPALGLRRGYAELGDLSRWADLGNGHLYPGGQPGSSRLDEQLGLVRSVVGGKPAVFTETGYHNAMNTRESHVPTPEDVAGVYAPELLLEHFSRGVVRMYNYELLDERADPGQQDREARFGLVRHDFSRKPAYTALQNLLRLVSDPGPAFVPGVLDYALPGAPADLRQVLLQKRDGRSYLALWRDTPVYDRDARRRVAVAAAPLTLTLGRPAVVAQYRPSSASGAVARTAGPVSTVPVPVGGELVVLEIG